MMKTSTLALSSLLPALVAAACVGPLEPLAQGDRTVEVGREVRLAPGQTAVIEGTGIAVTFVEVVEDSRCPVDVVCVWQGNVEVVLDFDGPGDGPTVRKRVNTAIEPRVVDHGGLTFAVTDVRPLRRESRTIEPDDYRITLRVTAAGGG